MTGRADEARAQLDRLRQDGMDLDQVTKELEAEGVEKFEVAVQSAVDTVAEHVT